MANLIPAASREELADFLAELDRRFPRKSYGRWLFRNGQSKVVEHSVRPLIRRALQAGTMRSLRDAVRSLYHLDHYDDMGTDYGFLKDLGARLYVIYLQAEHRLNYGGAPLAP